MSRRHLFGSLLALAFLVNLARVVFAPLIEPLAVAFEVSPASLGVVATAAWLGSAIPRLPTGYLLTRVPRHHVVVGAGCLLAAAALLTAAADSVAVLAGSALLLGLGSGVYFIAANPLVSELYPARIGRAIGVHGMASQLAAVGAPLLVTAVLLVGSWQTTFVLLAAAAGLATIATAAAARRADLPDAGGADRHLVRAVRSQWRLVLAGVAFVGVLGFVWTGVFNFYVTYLLTKGVAEGTARTLLTVTFAAGVPAFVVTGRLVDRFPSTPVLLAIIGGFAATVYALTLVRGTLAILATSVLMGYVVHGAYPAADTYLLSSLPDRHRASAYSGYSASMMVVQAMGSSVVGGLVGAGYSFDAVFRGFALGLAVLLATMAGLHAAGRLPTG